MSQAAPRRLSPLGNEIGHQTVGARGELLHLVVEDERGMGVAPLADLGGEERALVGRLVWVGHLQERGIGLVPGFGEIEAALLVPPGPILGADGVGRGEERVVGDEMGDRGGGIGHAPAKRGLAELAPDQKDQDTLPPYEELDAILQAYVEEDRSIAEIVKLGFNEATVKRVVAMVARNEYKRRQAAPGVRITKRAFGRDRRYPITSRFEWARTRGT